MTLVRKTFPCLMLVIALLVATAPGQSSSAPAATPAAPAITYSSGTAPRPTNVNAPAAAATPARYSSGYFYGAPGGSPLESALVIPAQEMDAEAVARIAEDLNIMSRIIEKYALSSFVSADRAPLDPFGFIGRAHGTSGPPVLFNAIGRPKPLYVAGYGATFFIQVDFPLLAPAAKAPEETPNPQEDQVWAETRRSLLEPETPDIVLPNGGPAVQPYSAERVDGLKKSLISTMKHASNIHALEAQEWLAIVVQGMGSSTADPTQAPSADATPSVGRQVMTLRAKKADVDSYARGEFDEAQFKQRVQVMTY